MILVRYAGETQDSVVTVVDELLGSVIEAEQVTPFVRELAEAKDWGSPKDNLRAEMQKAGVDPSYAKPTLFYIRPGLFCLMANHEYGVSATDAGQITAATLRARAEVHKLVDSLRRLGALSAA